MASISILAASAVLVALSARGAAANEQCRADQGTSRTEVAHESGGSDRMEASGHAMPRLVSSCSLAERSSTFRALLEDLGQSDVIVYVQVQHDPQSTTRGSLRFMGSGGGFRWVVATVETGTSRWSSFQENLVALTATLGHELQHAREVSTAPSIRSAAEFDTHFRTMGIDLGRNAVDTDAARQVGRIVEGEIRGSKNPAADGTATRYFPAVEIQQT